MSVRNSLFKVYSTLFENNVICVISVQSRSELVYKTRKCIKSDSENPSEHSFTFFKDGIGNSAGMEYGSGHCQLEVTNALGNNFIKSFILM